MLDKITDKQQTRYDPAAMGDLRVFLERAEAAGEFKRVKGADPELEIGAIFELSHENLYPPVMLFEEMKGCNPTHRMLCNVRVAKFVVGALDMDAVRAYRKRPKERSQPIPPRLVNTGPVYENVMEGNGVDINKLPTPRWHEGDGGNYVGTECLVIIKDPDSDWVNVGTYRVKCKTKDAVPSSSSMASMATSFAANSGPRASTVRWCISVGQAPVLGVSRPATRRSNVSEFAMAGGRIGQPIDVVNGARSPGCQFRPTPSWSSRATCRRPKKSRVRKVRSANGRATTRRRHGREPVLHVKAIYHRNDPIMIGKPPDEPTYPGRQINFAARQRCGMRSKRPACRQVKGVWKMSGGGKRFINVIAIKQQHPGHAKMAGLVAAGCGAGAYMNRMTIVVDDDIDITNRAEVMWAMATRWDPKTQTDIIDGCWTGHIDPMLHAREARGGRHHQQPDHHLCGAALSLEGRVPEGEQGIEGIRTEGAG